MSVIFLMFSRSLREFEWMDGLKGWTSSNKIRHGATSSLLAWRHVIQTGPDAPPGVLVTVTLERRGICKSTTALTTICSAWDGYCEVFFFYFFSPDTLSSLSLLLLPLSLSLSFSLLNKSVPSLNPVSTENCRDHVGCFSGAAWQRVWRV